MFTLPDIVRKRARLSADSEAVTFEGRRWSYSQLDRRSNQLANALQAMGMQKGDRIAVLAENCDWYLEIFFGLGKAGCVVAPLNFRLTKSELLFMLTNSAARVVFVGAGFEKVGAELRTQLPEVHAWVALDHDTEYFLSYEALLSASGCDEPVISVGENELAVIVYTGGTTGLPKGVMLSHRNILTSCANLIIEFGFGAHDVTCMILPLFHVAFWQAFSHLMVGGRVVVVRRPELQTILMAIEAERCTTINAIPTLYNWLINDASLEEFNLSSLRIMAYGGSPFPEEVLRKCIKKFGPIFAQVYGLSEAAPTVTFLAPEDHVLDGPKSKLLACAGREMTFTEIRIADSKGRSVPAGSPGEVLARGPNVMLGYWNNAELTGERLREGWLYTGDIGMVDDHGYLFLLDRKADMIVTGGENVYPSEVEGVLYRHPAIKECAVSSTPDDRWGESVRAVVVLQPGASATERDIIEFCKERLAGYKCPKRVDFWSELPKSVVGKLLRKDIKAVFWQGRKRSIG